MAETFTKFPNWLYDQIDSLTPDEWKIVSIIVRETNGYHRQEAVIDYKRMETIIANRSRLSALIDSLAERGFIKRRRAGRSFVYSMGNGPSDMLHGVTRQADDMLPDVTDTCYDTSHVTAEHVTPGNTLLYSKENKSKEKEKESEIHDPIFAIREHFAQRTSIQPNDRTGTYQRNWTEPLTAILAKANGDPAAAIVLIDAALDVAWGKNDSGKTYPVASPRSIATIAANLAATQSATTTAADDDSIWQRAIQAISRREYSDERLKAAIRAIGGTGRITSVNGHDADQLKRQLGNEYRRIPSPA